MSRLPTPNGDNDVWGDILNDFLRVAHNDDGTLKDVPADSTLVHTSGDENISGTKTFTASPLVPTPTSGSHVANKIYVDSVAIAGNVCQTFSYSGTIRSYTGTFRWYNDTGRTLTISAVRASLGTAPAGTSAIFDVLKSGLTIFSSLSNRPAIAPGAYTGLSGTPDVASLASGEYLTVNIAQVGSSTPGADLSLTVVMS